MSATSTSKQPMMADRPFMRVINLTDCVNDGFDANSGASAVTVADQLNGDGMILDDIALISRGAVHNVNLYISQTNQLFKGGRNVGDAQLVLRATCTATAFEYTHFVLPKLLTPVPRVGTDAKNTGLYIPRGYALWAAVDQATPTTSDAPNLLLQGGVY